MQTKKQKINEDAITRNILNKIRYNGAKILNENNQTYEQNENNVSAVIPITNDPKFGQSVLKNQIEGFKSAVDGGAKFNEVNLKNPNECPLLYTPEAGKLVFCGTLPSLNNLKWQYKLEDSDGGNGLFIWVDGLRLTEENIKILNKLCGYYNIWKGQWQESSSMLDSLGKSNE